MENPLKFPLKTMDVCLLLRGRRHRAKGQGRVTVKGCGRGHAGDCMTSSRRGGTAAADVTVDLHLTRPSEPRFHEIS